MNQFDSRNRLVQADSIVYHYDTENQRIGVDQTQFVVNSQPALSQVLVKEENGQKTFYVYGLGLIGQEVDGDYTSYHFDYRGSTVALTDSSGQIVEQYQYSPYGLLLSGDSSKTPFLFNGMYGVMTDSNNLYYMRARFYSPEIRRFVNQDILLGGIVEGQTLNRYAFVTGQPVFFVDPSGLIRQADPNGQECKALAKKIQNIKNDIAKRRLEVITNEGNLPAIAPTGSSPRDSVQGHLDIIKDLKKRLRLILKKYEDRCGGPPGGMPIPNQIPAQCPNTSSNNQYFWVEIGGKLFLIGVGIVFFPEITIPSLILLKMTY